MSYKIVLTEQTEKDLDDLKNNEPKPIKKP